MPSRFVLVVDTSPVSWQRVGRALSGSPCFAMSARSAADAEVAARAGELAVVVASMRLSDANGYDLARRLREVQQGLIVVLLNDGRDPYDAAQGEAAGVWAVIEWPCAADRLRRALDSALEGALAAPRPSTPPDEAMETMPAELVEAMPADSIETMPGEPFEAMPPDSVEVVPVDVAELLPLGAGAPDDEPRPSDAASDTDDGLVPAESDDAPPLPTSRLTPLESLPPIEDERLASFLPRDWRAYPPVRVDPASVGPAMERAILEVLPEVVDLVLRRALATSAILRELVEVAVDEAVRSQVGPIARRVIEERLAEIEAAADEGV